MARHKLRSVGGLVFRHGPSRYFDHTNHKIPNLKRIVKKRKEKKPPGRERREEKKRKKSKESQASEYYLHSMRVCEIRCELSWTLHLFVVA